MTLPGADFSWFLGPKTPAVFQLFSQVWSAGMVVLELANGKCPLFV